MHASMLAFVAALPWPFSLAPDPDPSSHYTYLLFVPPAFALAFALVYRIAPRFPAYASLPTRVRVRRFIGLGLATGVGFWVLLGIAQLIVDHAAAR
ncbi:MAG: hypothetical protein ABWX83_13930 [Luteibacter sp.]